MKVLSASTFNRHLVATLFFSLAIAGSQSAEAGKKKAKEAVEVTVIKLTNLTKDTKKADVRKLEKALKKVKGVKKVAVSKKKGEVTIRHTKTATADLLRAAIKTSGFATMEPAAENGADSGAQEEDLLDDAMVEDPAAE